MVEKLIKGPCEHSINNKKRRLKNGEKLRIVFSALLSLVLIFTLLTGCKGEGGGTTSGTTASTTKGTPAGTTASPKETEEEWQFATEGSGE